MDQATLPHTSAASRYDSLRIERDPYLRRARQYATLTIPAMLPPEGSKGDDYYTPFQSIGARGVNHLAAKILLAMFPPGASFFRLDLSPFALAELAEEAEANGMPLEDARAEFDMALSQVERAIVIHMEQHSARATLAEAVRHLVVAGNVLLHVHEDGSFRYFRLDHYVVKRDGRGNPIEIIVKETVHKETLPSEVRAFVDLNETEHALTGGNPQRDGQVDIYTRVKRVGRKWEVWQEAAGQIIPGTEGTYPLDRCAFLPLRWTKVDGEDYGRGHVEEVYGDLNSLEMATQAIVEYAGIAAKTLFFVNEAGVTQRKDVSEAPNGAVLDGEAKDVTVLRVEKLADFQVVKATAEEIARRLEQSFMLMSGLQRDAERVTAEEIRQLASELEQALGGVYSILAQEMQRPLVARIMHQMQKSKALPNLPANAVSPQIVTGLEGLGRNQDLIKLDLLIRGLAEVFGPQAVAEYVNVGAYMMRRAAALGIDLSGIIRSEEEVAQTREAQAQQQMAEKLGPAGIQAAAGIAKTDMTQD